MSKEKDYKTGERETVDCLRWLAGDVESFGQDLMREATASFLPSSGSSLLSHDGIHAKTFHT